MLLQATIAVTLFGMATTLWMGFYLFARGFPSSMTLRVWYNHAALYDAYMEGVPNREIMARLYISEGTFNRTRRNAIRGLARLLVEDNMNNA